MTIPQERIEQMQTAFVDRLADFYFEYHIATCPVCRMLGANHGVWVDKADWVYFATEFWHVDVVPILRSVSSIIHLPYLNCS